ncbi:hypothetical protein DFQ13_115116 [Actinokineospora spheciospongiae]|nr:hypothetical protein DFQ13_115116 [Actinokineospora spheciospongiae]
MDRLSRHRVPRARLMRRWTRWSGEAVPTWFLKDAANAECGTRPFRSLPLTPPCHLGGASRRARSGRPRIRPHPAAREHPAPMTLAGRSGRGAWPSRASRTPWRQPGRSWASSCGWSARRPAPTAVDRRAWLVPSSACEGGGAEPPEVTTEAARAVLNGYWRWHAEAGEMRGRGMATAIAMAVRNPAVAPMFRQPVPASTIGGPQGCPIGSTTLEQIVTLFGARRARCSRSAPCRCTTVHSGRKKSSADRVFAGQRVKMYCCSIVELGGLEPLTLTLPARTDHAADLRKWRTSWLGGAVDCS